MTIEEIIQCKVAEAVGHLYGAACAAETIQLQNTRKDVAGDFTIVVFPLLKASRKSPQDTAQELGQYLLDQVNEVSAVEAIKGFLNVTIAPAYWVAVLASAQQEERFGYVAAQGHSPLVMIEYSSPNTNKPLHLGHIRNNLLGFSLSQLLQATGKRVVKTNIVNDRGIHICKSMYAWQQWGEGKTPENTGIKGDHLVGDFYVLFDKKYKEEVTQLQAQGCSKEEAEQQAPSIVAARELLRKWEAKDEETRKLWERMNQWVYAGFDVTYRQLGVDFDQIYYESDTYLTGKEEVLRGLKEGVFVREPDQSVWADLTGEGLDRKILLRSDGTSVYMTQDIGTAKLRFKDYPIDKMVYVVGNEQDYHFKVLSIVLDKLGFAWGKGLHHFSYGMVELPHGKMKSREGTVVDADDLMAEMVAMARQTSEELGKLDGLSAAEIEQTHRDIALGSLKYFMLKVDPKKNMTFNPEESIDFNGNTGSFIQYAHARICSILRKAKEQRIDIGGELNAQLELSQKEIELIKTLALFPSTLQEAAQAYSPAVVANYVYNLVKEYNQFYHDCSILNEENHELRHFRLVLSANIAKVIRLGMDVLGISVPERM